jgi:carbon monoxide dehydrogenase subunit G
MPGAYIPSMATELDHTFTTDKSLEDSYASILDLERVVPAVEGGSVTEVVDGETVKAEILMRMGAMSMKLVGTVEVAEKDDAAKRAVLKVRSKEVGGTGHANAEVTVQLRDGGGDIHTNAQITGKAASMGEGVVVGVLDALIQDFTTKVGQI